MCRPGAALLTGFAFGKVLTGAGLSLVAGHRLCEFDYDTDGITGFASEIGTAATRPMFIRLSLEMRFPRIASCRKHGGRTAGSAAQRGVEVPPTPRCTVIRCAGQAWIW